MEVHKIIIRTQIWYIFSSHPVNIKTGDHTEEAEEKQMEYLSEKLPFHQCTNCSVDCFEREPLSSRSWQNSKTKNFPKFCYPWRQLSQLMVTKPWKGYETLYTTDTSLNIRAEKEYKEKSQTTPNCPII